MRNWKKQASAAAALVALVAGGSAARADSAATQKTAKSRTASAHQKTAAKPSGKSAAAATPKTTPGSTAKSSSTGRPGQKTAARTGQHSSPHHAPPRPLSAKAKLAAARRRRALLRPEPDRIIEIQKALAQAGYPNVQLTGRWDDATRDAMRSYQAANGFPPTGLPEAKSLMKLGLGPHPLPAELDSPSAKPAGDTATRTPSSSGEGSRQ